MRFYTIHDLMLIAGVEEGEPRRAARVGATDEMPYLPNESISADDGDEFNLTYDDGRDLQTVRVQV